MLRASFLMLALFLAVGGCNKGGDEEADRVAKRGMPEKKPGPPAPPAIPEGPPFVGKEGVDAHGYPLRRPDRTVLLALLLSHRFAELEAALVHYQDAFEADPRKEWWPHDGLDAFAVPDPSVGALLDQWVGESPESFAARAARGVWHDAVGWKHRGHGFIDETTDAQLEAMRAEHAKASVDLEHALRLRTKLLSAVVRLLHIARTAGDEMGLEHRYVQGRAICEECLSLHRSYVLAHAPRWGGSHPEMTTLADSLVEFHPGNPALAGLTGLVPYDRCRTLAGKKDWDGALAECRRAVATYPDPLFLCMQARVLNGAERYDRALAPLDAALAVDPQNLDCLQRRELARRRTKDYWGAAQDLLVVRRLDPFDDELDEHIEWTLKRLRYDAAEAAKAGDAEGERKHLDLANTLLPGSGKPAGGVTGTELIALQARVDAAPDDFELRLQLDHALAVRGRFDDIIAMWDAFISTHPDHAQAHRERGGARWHAGDHQGAIADTQRACDLKDQKSCGQVQAMRKRAENL